MSKQKKDFYQPLFNHMSEEHGLTLTQCQMDDIIQKVSGMIVDSAAYQGRPCGLLHSTDWYGKCFKCGEQVFDNENENQGYKTKRNGLGYE